MSHHSPVPPRRRPANHVHRHEHSHAHTDCGHNHHHDHHDHDHHHRDHDHHDHHHDHDGAHDDHLNHSHDNCSHDHNHGHGGCDHDQNGVWAYLPHAHGLSERIQADKRSLKMASCILAVSLCVQLGGGMLVDSSVLEAEAVHTALDGLVLAVSLMSIALASRARTSRYTYGYSRAEVLSALVSVLTLALMCMQLGGGAVMRLLSYHGLSSHKAVRKGQAVFVAEGLTLVNNVLIAIVLGRNSSLNIRALRAHVVGDSIGNVVVLVAGAVMWARPGMAVLDPILTLVVVTAICALNAPLARETVEVLMQAAPKSFGSRELSNRVVEVRGVKRVRDAHVWTLTSGAVVASVKLEADPEIRTAVEYVRIQEDVEKLIAKNGVSEVTVQVNAYTRSDDSDEEQGAFVKGRRHRIDGDARYELVGGDDDVV